MINPIPPAAGNMKAMASIETSPGIWTLLMGRNTASSFIFQRDTSVFLDAGTSYEANAVIGSTILAHPGELAELGFITAEFVRTGSSPGIHVLMDEIDGNLSAYGNISGYVISDPPLLYGATGHPATLYANRYYFKQTDNGKAPQPAYCRHMMTLIDFGNTDSTQNEMLSLTIYGSILTENG